jgi:hypothetical protein
MMTCPHCYAQFQGFTVFAGEDPDALLADLLSRTVAGYKAVATGSREGVTRRQLFEAAVGTLSIVAKDVPELQAAKIRGAIDALLACTT